MTTLELTEHIPCRFDRDAMSLGQGEALMTRFGKFIEVQFPTPRTNYRWELTPKGWIGVVAVDHGCTVVCNPKVPVGNLARMIADVYELSVEDFPELVTCATLPDLYEQLALVLAKRVIQLGRQGLHQAYLPANEDRTAVRGRLVMTRQMYEGSATRLRCQFTERSADIPQNQIPLWALGRVLQTQLCSPTTQAVVRQAYRLLSGAASLRPATALDCDRVTFDRLTGRYRPALAISRLLIEGSAPVAASGVADAPPFLLHMPTLFERYVLQWLAKACRNSPVALRVEGQERNVVGDAEDIEFVIDVVLYEERFGRALCVLDTKYKDSALPSAADVAQVGYYALLKRAPLASLVYPTHVNAWQSRSGDVQTFRSSFDLSKDLETAGNTFFDALLDRIQTVQDQQPFPSKR